MKIISILLSFLLFSFAPTTSKVDPAELVLINGNIYTVNDKQPHAEAVAIKGGRIVFVGSNAAAKQYQGANTRVVDLKGATVVPGMTDAHQHLEGVGFREMTLNLEGITNLQDFLAKVKARVDQAKPGEWVTGRGWIETFWTPPVFPTRWDLDKVSPNNPVILGRSDGHGTVVNSAALKIAGITKDTPSPFGGEISKDKQSGEPNGMLLDAAQGLVRRHVPPTSQADAERAVVLGVQRDIGLGWTQVQNPGGSYEDIDIYRKLYSESGSTSISTRAPRSSTCPTRPAATSPFSARSRGPPSACSPPPPPGCSRATRRSRSKSCLRCWSTRRSRPPRRWHPARGPRRPPGPRAEIKADVEQLRTTVDERLKSGERSSVVLVLFGADAADTVLDRSGTEALRGLVHFGPETGLHVLGWWRSAPRLRSLLMMSAVIDDVGAWVALDVQGAELQQFLPGTLFSWSPRPGRALFFDRAQHSQPQVVVVPGELP